MRHPVRFLILLFLVFALALTFALTSQQHLQAQATSALQSTIINTIYADGTQITGVELADGGVGNSDLSGLTVVFLNGTTNQINGAYDLAGLSSDENGYLVLGLEGSSPVPAVTVDKTVLGKSTAVAIYSGAAADFATGTTANATNRIELARYGFDSEDELSFQITRTVEITGVGESAQAAAASRALPPADFGACGDAATSIDAVQGSEERSPQLGETVIIEAAVVGDFQDRQKQMRGFFLQENNPDSDNDPATSSGIFVLDGGTGIDVKFGDQVRVQGRVDEFNGMTRLKNLKFVQVCASDVPIAATTISLPVASVGALEQFEGMYVQIDGELTVAQNYFLGRYGQLTLAAGGRPLQPTHLFAPDSDDAKARADLNARSMLVLDDGEDLRDLGENPNPVPYLGAPPPAVIRAGDVVNKLIGVLDQGRINSAPRPDTGIGYRLQPTAAPVFGSVNKRSDLPPPVGGTLRIASANVLNYFNGDGLGGGFPTERGAASKVEFQRQRAKTIAAITALNADIIGLMEIENDGYGKESAIQDLVNGLNAAAAVSNTYAFIDPAINLGIERLGDDAIQVGLLYKPALVKPVGNAATLNSGAFDQTLPDGKSRQPLAQTFEMTNGQRITVAVLHLKSKRPGISDSPADMDNGNGTGAWNGRRTEAAQQVVDWLAGDPTGAGTQNVLIIGDLNAYAGETPISTIEAAGYTNLLKKFHGKEAYSYVFNGQSGYLDHALASSALMTQVVNAEDWHINADEPKVLDYEAAYNPPGYYSAEPYRSSDHDPVLIGVSLGTKVNNPKEEGNGGFEPFTCASRYTVRYGDTLFAIAFRHGVSYYSLVTLNQISNPSLIFVGQSLCIPGTALPPTPTVETYVVKPGDTLFAIAIRLRVSANALMRANGIWDPNFIYVGQVLTVPR